MWRETEGDGGHGERSNDVQSIRSFVGFRHRFRRIADFSVSAITGFQIAQNVEFR